MKLTNKDNKLYLDNRFLGYIKDNTVDEDGDKMFEINTFEEVNLILSLKGKEIIPNILFHGLVDDILYKIFVREDYVVFEITKFLDVKNWKLSISPVEYCELFKIKGSYNISIYEDGNVLIGDIFHISEEETLQDYYKYFFTEITKTYNQIVFKNDINESITFSSEHLTAGISILQYFAKILQEKYPNEDISVSIKQKCLKVTMIIEMPDGKREEIKEYLNRYGMVVTNQITPEEFASNPIQLIELKQELREAQSKILFQQELLSLKDDTYKNRIISLEDEVKFLRKEISEALLTNKENIQILLNSLLTKDKVIKNLTKSIENRNDVKTKQLLLEIKEKDLKGYISLKQHIDNAIIGGIVNAPSWIQFTVGILSKVG